VWKTETKGGNPQASRSLFSNPGVEGVYLRAHNIIHVLPLNTSLCPVETCLLPEKRHPNTFHRDGEESQNGSGLNARSAALIGGELEKNAAGEESQTNQLASAQPRLITGELAHEGVHNYLSRIHCR
jgi:hypothetical protein